MYIPIILGTAREGRRSELAARFVLGQVQKRGLETEILDVKECLIGTTNNNGEIPQAKKLAEKISRADGLIIVSPEYNHGYPGELKVMLDMLYDEYNHKPLGICGVSIGALGGARMVEQLRLVAIELKMVPIREAVYFSKVGELFDASGAVKDTSFEERTKKFLDELVWYAEALKIAREKK